MMRIKNNSNRSKCLYNFWKDISQRMTSIVCSNKIHVSNILIAVLNNPYFRIQIFGWYEFDTNVNLFVCSNFMCVYWLKWWKRLIYKIWICVCLYKQAVWHIYGFGWDIKYRARICILYKVCWQRYTGRFCVCMRYDSRKNIYEKKNSRIFS